MKKNDPLIWYGVSSFVFVLAVSSLFVFIDHHNRSEFTEQCLSANGNTYKTDSRQRDWLCISDSGKVIRI